MAWEQGSKHRRKAARMLLLATLFWGVSFPAMKALGLLQQRLVPEAGSWFVTSNVVVVRFAVAAFILLIWSWRTARQMTFLELWQGAGLGLFAGGGMLFQMDGLAYTSASTSAFLTQCYCLVLPVIAALQERKRPAPLISVCSVMVVVGVAILAGIDWRDIRLGRGEWETLIGSASFTGQILWLERPLFARNRVSHVTLVMFTGMTMIALPVAVWTTPTPTAWLALYQSGAVLGLVGVLIVFCTLTSFVMMNRWQPHLAAAEAGLIYTAEPVFASLFALVLPAWFSALGGLSYPNEQLTSSLLIGGGLITAANVLIQVKAASGNRPNEIPTRRADDP